MSCTKKDPVKGRRLQKNKKRRQKKKITKTEKVFDKASELEKTKK